MQLERDPYITYSLYGSDIKPKDTKMYLTAASLAQCPRIMIWWIAFLCDVLNKTPKATQRAQLRKMAPWFLERNLNKNFNSIKNKTIQT